MKSEYPRAYYGEATSTATYAPLAFRSYREALENFVRSLPRDATVLDVGCGEGRTLLRIQEIRPDLKLFGIDHSNVASLLPEEVSFLQGSVEELEKWYGKERFDAVICQHVIEHLPYPLRLVSGMHTILRPGGRVFLETPNWTRLLVPFSFLYFWNDYTHVHPYTSFALHRLFLEHGFSVDTLRSISSCSWKRHRSGQSSEGDSPSAFAHTHLRRGFFARGLAYLLNPLLRDLLIFVGTKR